MWVKSLIYFSAKANWGLKVKVAVQLVGEKTLLVSTSHKTGPKSEV